MYKEFFLNIPAPVLVKCIYNILSPGIVLREQIRNKEQYSMQNDKV